ncbi:hypothetical protein GCM10009860_21990 [Microbacterium mitrae]|uniref:DUF998 domain-containing protein n=1 Tax=Microbacterium mitrae TaxID=664640 RepID=A0A5C8HN53_9MICO|nr:DUF998 domain-containing protein [Microbacterium mitrae]TXK04112.1 DUF998 domain-containing protein [Microbacterium mitrae]
MNAPLGSSQTREVRSTRFAIIAFVLGALLGILVAGGRHLPVGGPESWGNIAAWVTGALTGLGFALAYLLPGGGRSEPRLRWRHEVPLVKRIIDLVALTGATAMLNYLIVMAVAAVFEMGFRGLMIDPLGGGVLVGFAAAAMTYGAALAGSRVSGTSVATLAISVLFIGTVASMVSSPDASWWQLHFSELGNTAGVTGYRFNLALITTGLVITVLAGYVRQDFASGLRRRGFDVGRRPKLLGVLFGGIGVCMMVVGLVPDAENFAVHVSAGSGMVVLFGAFAFVSLRYIPDLPRDLIAFTTVVVVGIIVAVLLWVPIGYYNLTGMELVAAGLLFAWLMVFVRAVEAYGAVDDDDAGSAVAEHRDG